MQTTAPEIHFSTDLRRVLRRCFHQENADDSNVYWPDVGSFARWCHCSPVALLKYASGEKQSLDPDVMDTIVHLTGVYPNADATELKARFANADSWHRPKSNVRSRFNTIMDYLQNRYEARQSKKCRNQVQAANSLQVFVSIHKQLRNVLRLGGNISHQFKGAHIQDDWPSVEQYAAWCDCPFVVLESYVSRYQKRLDPLIMDQLLFLIGFFPRATNRERKQRIADANRWLGSAKTRERYSEMMDYLQRCYAERETRRQLSVGQAASEA